MTIKHDDGEGVSIDPLALYELVNRCIDCDDLAQFKRVLEQLLPSLLPHRGMIAVIGSIDLDHLQVLRVLDVDAPPALLGELAYPLRMSDRLALKTWLTQRQPVVLGGDDGHGLMSGTEARELSQHQLGRVAAHGEVDLAARSGSYFSFFGVDRALPAPQIRRLLESIIPPLHQAFVRLHKSTLAHDCDAENQVLTDTELEILKWVSAGRSNSEIAQLRARSVATVRNQLHRIYEKLGVANRLEAVRWLQRH